MYKATGTHIIVRIDRELQRKKSILTNAGLIAAPEWEFMQYNLQFGKILSVGEEVDPLAQVGMNAILHHLVEEEERFLIERDPSTGDMICWVNTVTHAYNNKFYGVMDEDGNPTPVKTFVICHPQSAFDQDLVYDELTMPGLPSSYRVAAKKEGLLYVPQFETPEEKKYFRLQIAAVSPDETYLKAGQRILVSNDFTPYPIILMGKEYEIVYREFITSTIQ